MRGGERAREKEMKQKVSWGGKQWRRSCCETSALDYRHVWVPSNKSYTSEGCLNSLFSRGCKCSPPHPHAGDSLILLKATAVISRSWKSLDENSPYLTLLDLDWGFGSSQVTQFSNRWCNHCSKMIAYFCLNTHVQNHHVMLNLNK